jgi:hypothetical protein
MFPPSGPTAFFFVAGLVFLRIGARFVLLSHAHQKTDQIVQFTDTERGSVVRWHQRIPVSPHACYVGLHEQIESAAQRLQLQREIVFVAQDSSEGQTSTSRDGDSPAGLTRRLTRFDNVVANFFRRTRPTVRRQIGGDESARAGGQVTVGASRTTEENRLPILGIPRQGHASRFTLKKAKISDQRSTSGCIKSAERGHPGGCNSTVDDLRERRIAAPLCFRRRCNVRCAFTTATVDTVTPCAPILKNLASIGNRTLRLCRSGRAHRSSLDT